ncbi:MAG TPA: DNA-directed RNA polymerase subunit omega [Rectinemataceae bacterium]|jgi:DNA-directed RNA polymerase subunit omega|nr:DNA-directed RNA polymerase subunit omega [Rectinemataceae bacterium]HUX42301.1 DNA-directed RNA polymerase subunit omega [Rectinemataceae bacterium]
MIMPLEQLIEYDQNAYELTVAVTHRAYQLAVIRGPEVDKISGKVVSLATRQIFTKQIEYRLLD